jgi:hypothetical protein
MSGCAGGQPDEPISLGPDAVPPTKVGIDLHAQRCPAAVGPLQRSSGSGSAYETTGRGQERDQDAVPLM